MDYYTCEECGKVFDEFEMNYAAAVVDKKELCRECRQIIKPFPNKKYSIILADPPWNYYNTSPPCKIEKQPETCSVNYYYPTMTLEDIKNLPVNDLADRDCVLFLWATTPNIQEAFGVMEVWGFKYKTMITWEKTNNDCMGYWFRVCTEHLLVGIKGKVKAFRNMARTCYHEKRGKHSKKPNYFYGLIEEATIGNKIELFARYKRSGWDAWGNKKLDDNYIQETLKSQ